MIKVSERLGERDDEVRHHIYEDIAVDVTMPRHFMDERSVRCQIDAGKRRLRDELFKSLLEDTDFEIEREVGDALLKSHGIDMFFLEHIVRILREAVSVGEQYKGIEISQQTLQELVSTFSHMARYRVKQELNPGHVLAIPHYSELFPEEIL